MLAQLKRRKIMVPALLRMAYTVGFETLSAQASAGYTNVKGAVRASRPACAPCCALFAHPARVLPEPCTPVYPAVSLLLPFPLHLQYLFFGPTKKYGVSDSIVRNVGETAADLGKQLSVALTHHPWARALHLHAS